MSSDSPSSNPNLPEFTYEQIVEGKRPPVLSGPYIPAYLVRAEIERLRGEYAKVITANAEVAAINVERQETIERLRAFLAHWTYEGALQTFEDRQRFRNAAHELLRPADETKP